MDSGAPRGPGLFNLIMGPAAADKQKRFIREEVWRSGDKAAGSCSRRPTPRQSGASIEINMRKQRGGLNSKHMERKEKGKHSSMKAKSLNMISHIEPARVNNPDCDVSNIH